MSSVLTITGLAFVVLAGLVHVLIFALESLLWRSRRTWRQFGIRSAEDAEVARPWAFNQGFYNLFLAVGAIAGGVGAIVGLIRGSSWVAWAPLEAADAFGWGPRLDGWGWVAVFSALCMLGAAVVLLASSRGKQLRGTLIQGTAPLIGLVLLAAGAAVAPA